MRLQRQKPLLSLVTLLLSTPTLSQAQNGPIVPFTTLPACAANCGHLYDAQGLCAPPNLATVDLNCFCNDSRVNGLATGQDVCVNHPCSASDLAVIAKWFQGICSVNGNTGSTVTSAPGSGATATVPGSAQSSAASGGGGAPVNPAQPTWFSTHWQWVVMLIVLVIGIAGLWVAAVLLRRRYKRKRELQYELRPPGAPWVQGQNMASPYGVFGDGIFSSGKNKETIGVVMPEKVKQKWIVKERT